MRILLIALVASSCLLVQTSGSALPSDILPRKPRDLSSGSRTWSWRVQNQDQDHITYVRSPAVGSPATSSLTLSIPEPDCNKTTTPAPLPTRGTRRPVDVGRGTVGGRRNQPELRSRGSVSSAGHGAGLAVGNTGNRVQAVQTTTESHPHEGNYIWMVSHRTDDHITYRRRSNKTQGVQSGEDQAQGQLRQLGTGSDIVSARVVDSKNDEDISTEEGLLNRGSSNRGRNQHGGSHLTYDLVHPYATRNHTVKAKSSRRNESTRSGAESSHSRQSQRELKSNAPTGKVNIFYKNPQATNEDATANATEDADTSYPNVGDVVDGWRVVSKNKEHISWERAVPTLPSTSAPPAAASLQLKSLDSNVHLESERGSSSRASSRHLKSGRSGQQHQRRGQASQQSQSSSATGIGEGFPVVFETYSKATFENEDVNLVGTIRTTLTNTSNWQVGDELSGWKVISKDGEGITWEKVKSADDSGSAGRQLKSGGRSESDYSDENDLNEEDLLNLANQRAGATDDESGAYKGPPGTWYLAKESKNHITWRRDDVPEDVIFDMNEYPRIGDVQSQWQVSDKSKNHISWKRTGTSDSDEVPDAEV